jgi:Icc-related predicted phosphoesterase
MPFERAGGCVVKIAVIGDVHDDPRLAPTLDLLRGESFDLAILAGDIGVDPPWLFPFRRLFRGRHDASVRRVLETVRTTLGCEVVFVPGNHDLPDPPRDVAGLNADGTIVEVAGLRIAGLGGAGPAHHGFPYEWREAEADHILGRLLPGASPGPDVFLSHAPPLESTLDVTHRGAHVGSETVRRAIERSRPALFVCGHIHEATGVEPLHGVPCLNAGALGEPYGAVMAWRVTWEAGRPSSIDSFAAASSGSVRRTVWVSRPG